MVKLTTNKVNMAKLIMNKYFMAKPTMDKLTIFLNQLWVY
jgi:hypothetical protein